MILVDTIEIGLVYYASILEYTMSYSWTSKVLLYQPTLDYTITKAWCIIQAYLTGAIELCSYRITRAIGHYT